MMRKKISILLLFVFYCAVGCLTAGSKMDLQLLRTIRTAQAKAMSHGVEPSEPVSVTVLAILCNDATLPRADFESLGIRIGTQVGRVVTLRVPVNSLQALSEHPSVEQLNASRHHRV